MLYEFVKNLFLQLTPPSLVVRYQRHWRSLAYLAYAGRTYRCNLCGVGLRTFIGEARICPHCGSLARGRRLYELLAEAISLRPGAHVLHFSPSPPLAKKISTTYPQLVYQRSDFVGEFAADRLLDLRDTGLPTASFDLIACYHILEHIDEDQRAMRELYRLLRPGGLALVQTPFCAADGPSLEDDTVITPAERLAKFGQADHVRIYSVSDLAHRLEQVGFRVSIVEYKEEWNHPFGFKPEEVVLYAHK